MLYSSAFDLLNRFTSEQNYIKQYVNFLHLKTSVFEYEVSDLFYSLEKFDLAKVTRRDVSVWDAPYSHDELASLNDQLEDVPIKLQIRIKAEEEFFEKLVEPSNVMRTSINSAEGQMMEWIMLMIGNNPSKDELNTLRNELRDHIQQLKNEYGIQPIAYKTELIDYYIDGAIYLKTFQSLQELKSLPVKLQELSLLTRITAPHAEINIYRQGFINLITIFDATIFDIVRMALQKDFFNLISIFGKQEKLALKELNNYSSFDDFKNKIIEEQLKAKYLKDILFILKSLGVDCVDSKSGMKFIQLIELTQRRNIHIHNRGLVDEKYLEKDEQGSPKYNFYNLAFNHLAEIDSEYFELANRLCLDCVNLTVQWTDSLN